MPTIWVHKIGDVYGGQKSPFDCFGCYDGKFFCIEFKKKGGKLKEHQEQALKDVHKNGGLSFIGIFGEKEKERDLSLYYYPDKSQKIEIIYKKGYTLNDFFNFLSMLQ